MSTRYRLLLFVTAGVLVAALPGSAQERAGGETADYLAAAGRFFRVASAETELLRAWHLPPEEIPVLLFVSTRAGVPADVIGALRQRGTEWAALLNRFGLGPGNLYLPDDRVGEKSLGPLASRFEGIAPERWAEIRLTDPEVVLLVNMRFLAAFHGVPPAEAWKISEREGGYIRAHAVLAHR